MKTTSIITMLLITLVAPMVSFIMFKNMDSFVTTFSFFIASLVIVFVLFTRLSGDIPYMGEAYQSTRFLEKGSLHLMYPLFFTMMCISAMTFPQTNTLHPAFKFFSAYAIMSAHTAYMFIQFKRFCFDYNASIQGKQHFTLFGIVYQENPDYRFYKGLCT